MKRLIPILLLVVIIFAAGVKAAEVPKIDLGGQTIRIQCQWYNITPIGPRVRTTGTILTKGCRPISNQ